MSVPVEFLDTEIQRELRQLLTAVLNDHVSGDTVRSVMLALGVDEALFATLVQSGVHALLLAETHGGAGASLAEAALVAEVLATKVTPVPYLSHAVFTPALLAGLADLPARTRLYHAMAQGERATVAYRNETGHPHKPSSVVLTTQHDSVGVSGVSGHVLDGAGAKAFVVLAQREGHAVFVHVPRDTPGVSVASVSVLDLTRPLANVTFDAVTLPASFVLHGDAKLALERGKRAVLVALSNEAVGGLTALLAVTTAYAKQRVQFGRAIGSFQAVKHRLVDVLIAKEAALSAAHYAAQVFDGEDDKEAAIAALTAAAYCLPAYVDASLACLQIFGGIGFTWEHEMHLHVKRAKTSSLLFGSPADHRRELANVLGLCG